MVDAIMGRFKWIITVCFIVILGNLFSACSNVKNEVGNTENTTYIEDTMHTEDVVDTEILYVETDDSYRVKNSVDIDKTLSDGEIMDWKKWDRIENHILLKESIDIYNADKGKVGYTKPNIKAVYIAVDDEWSHLAIGESGYSVYVRTDELLAVMEEKIEVSDVEIKDTETAPKEDEESTYTVTNLDKTMYAKQSVNLRSGPSTDYEKIGSLTTNQEVTVTGIADTGWYRISYNGGVAFVSDNYLSDAKVEIALPDDGGNTNEDENNGEEEYTPPTDDDIIYIPEEPKYTVDEVISIVKSTLESNGIICSTDYAPPEAIEEFGADLGMGWGIDWVPMDDPYTYANSMVEGFQYWGFDMYYIYYEGIENGCVRLKTHWGTRGQ